MREIGCNYIDCEQEVLIREYEDKIEAVVLIYHIEYMGPGRPPKTRIEEIIWYTKTIKNERNQDTLGDLQGSG